MQTGSKAVAVRRRQNRFLNHERYKWILLVVSLFGFVVFFAEDLLLPSLSVPGPLSEKTSFMSKKEQSRLEYFFRKLIFWDDGSYILAGSKPCSMAVFYKPFCLNSHFLDSITVSNIRVWLGWKTWKKYEDHFPHPRFSILKEKRKKGSYFLLFIHKEALARIILDHSDDFKAVLGDRIDIPQILSGTQPLVGEILRNNELLIGIVLGYGRANAMHYFQKSKKLTSFIEEQEQILFSKYIATQGIWGFASGRLFKDLSQISLPGFSVDPNDLETLALRKKYKTSRETLIAYFGKRNFLDATLELLTQSPN
jgi:hypothetical protein